MCIRDSCNPSHHRVANFSGRLIALLSQDQTFLSSFVYVCCNPGTVRESIDQIRYVSLWVQNLQNLIPVFDSEIPLSLSLIHILLPHRDAWAAYPFRVCWQLRL